MSFLEAGPDETPSSLSHPENQVGYGIVDSGAAASAATHDATPARSIGTCELHPGGHHHITIKVVSRMKHTVTVTPPDSRNKAARVRAMSICTIMARLRLYDQLRQLRERNRSTTVSIAAMQPPYPTTAGMMPLAVALHSVCWRCGVSEGCNGNA